MNTEKSKEECLELKNIKYKTMLLSGVPLKETKQSNNLDNLDKFLEDEKNTNKCEPWCKLDKTIKTKKIIDYVELYKNGKGIFFRVHRHVAIEFKDNKDNKPFG